MVFALVCRLLLIYPWVDYPGFWIICAADVQHLLNRHVASKSNIFSYFRCTICTYHLMCVGVMSSVFCSTLCNGVLSNDQFWWWVKKHGAGRERKRGGLLRETSLSMVFVVWFFTAISIIQYFMYLGTATIDLIYSCACLRHLQIVIQDREMQKWETRY